MIIENNYQCFVMLWRKLELTRRLLGGQYKRFCIRRVLQSWRADGTLCMAHGKSLDDFIFDVCMLSNLEGFGELPPPSQHPRPNREFLRAVIAVHLYIKKREVNQKDLDRAYSEVFPRSTPINVEKKAPRPPKDPLPRPLPLYGEGSHADMVGNDS